MFHLGNIVVNLSSKRQPMITRFTIKAKNMAINQATREAMWLQRLLNELGFT